MTLIEQFDEHLLQAFTDGFYGYGTFDAPYWLVGMEEGGGGSFHNIQNRLIAWDQRGRSELEDLVEFSAAFGLTRFFSGRATLQRTWNKLIRILLSAEGEEVSTDLVRQYQAKLLARRNGMSSLLELLPLPSPSTEDWLYARHSTLPQLQDRWTYTNHYAGQRATHIRQRIQEHQPRAVVFYSMSWSYQQWWRTIAGVDFSEVQVGTRRLYLGNNAATTFVITHHPVTHGVSNQYFHEVGRLIASSKLDTGG